MNAGPLPNDQELGALWWIKSSRSNNQGANCVELALSGTIITIRDSKNPTEPALTFTTTQFDAFRHAIKRNAFDLP